MRELSRDGRPHLGDGLGAGRRVLLQGGQLVLQPLETRLGVVHGLVRDGDAAVSTVGRLVYLALRRAHGALDVRQGLVRVIGTALGRLGEVLVGAELLLVLVLHLLELLGEGVMILGELVDLGLGGVDVVLRVISLAGLLGDDGAEVAVHLVAVIECRLVGIEVILDVLHAGPSRGVLLARRADLAHRRQAS